MNEEYVYNWHDDEDWSCCSEDKDEVVRQLLEELTLDELESTTKVNLFKGKKVIQKFEYFFDVDDIIEYTSERAYENCGDHAETFLDEVTSDMKVELENLVLGWANKHDLDPNFFMIENIEEEWYDVPKELIKEEIKSREEFNIP